ncbi:hypothetical protein ACJRO7_018599 [Eucalyptus globulus]|uniref:Hyaluronan/mRNA-binding protein domain-containing protein n=1 Tax=Eucalyptus globulus TaxID=34317 RepID=A0ABD3KYF0_EUCGL
MATANPFDILGDDDNEDPSQLLAAAAAAKPAEKPKKGPAQAAAPPSKPAAKLPSKPLPPAQAVKEARSDTGGRGRGRGGGRGYGRGRGGGRGYDQDSGNYDGPAGNNGFSGGYRPSEEGDSGKSSERGGRGFFRGGRPGGYNNGEAGEGERPRRAFDRRSGTGRGETEEPVTEVEKTGGSEKQLAGEDGADASKEKPLNEPEEKEPEEKEMTLEEYEKVFEENRKSLLALKTEERKVELDKDLKSMQQLSNKKKDNNDIFIKLGSEKDKRKEAAEKEEKAKKSVSINEFLKPAEGERYYNPGGRGRGRGRGARGGYSGGGGGGGGGGYGYARDVSAPSIEDPGQFPSLGGK